MIPVAPDQRFLEQGAEDFDQAFWEEALIQYLFPEIATRKQKLLALFTFFIRSRNYVIHAISLQWEGVTLWQSPHPPTPAQRVSYVLQGLDMLLKRGPRSAFRLFRYEGEAKKIHQALANFPHHSLFMVYVAPAHQGKGQGKALIQAVVEVAHQAGLPVYLETQPVKNVEIYQKRGFHLQADTPLLDGALWHYAMLTMPPHKD